MSLYEDWIRAAYDKDGKSNKATWDEYMPIEQSIYEMLLETKTTTISGTVKELGARFHMSHEFVCGFIDGINEAVAEPIKLDELTTDSFVALELDFEKLFRKMVEYKAEHLYNLPQWENIFSAERQKEMYYEQKRAGTVVKGEKPGRNDPCPCGSGKKYKKCCGASV